MAAETITIIVLLDLEVIHVQVVVLPWDEHCTTNLFWRTDEEEASLALLGVRFKHALLPVLWNITLLWRLLKHAGTEEAQLHHELVTLWEHSSVLAAVDLR